MSLTPPPPPGQLILIVEGKETPCYCFLFNNHIALAEWVTDHFKILAYGMVPLSGAQLHKSVDIEGQPISADLLSGGHR